MLLNCVVPEKYSNVLHYAMYNVHCITYIVHCTMYAMYNVHCITYIVHCTMYKEHVQCTMLCNVQCTLHNIHCALHNVQRTLYKMYMCMYVWIVTESLNDVIYTVYHNNNLKSIIKQSYLITLQYTLLKMFINKVVEKLKIGS